jgi:hypothetical protein
MVHLTLSSDSAPRGRASLAVRMKRAVILKHSESPKVSLAM